MTFTSENQLERGYGLLEGKPCACGLTIYADPFDPGPGVASHNLSTRHAQWRYARLASDIRSDRLVSEASPRPDEGCA